MSRSGNLAVWQSGLNWMDDDEDQDSDTDSKLSGSAIVDSVMWVLVYSIADYNVPVCVCVHVYNHVYHLGTEAVYVH